MHIAIDATSLYGRFGGVEYSLWNLMRALTRFPDHRFSVFIPANGPALEQTAPFGKNWRWIRLGFTGRHRWRRILWQQLELPRWLAAHQPDLLHAGTYVGPWRTDTPLVASIYDVIALTHPEYATPANRLHYRFALPQTIRAARRLLVPSPQVAQEITALFPEVVARVRQVPLGVEDFFLHPVEASARERIARRFHLPERFLLYVGNHEPKKNLAALVQSLDLLPDSLPLVMAGGMQPWGVSLPAHPRVKRIGYVRRPDLPALYSLAEALVSPSLVEGFGLPVLEAMAVGTPVVAGAGVALPDLREMTWVLEQPSPQEIARGITELLGSQEMRRRLVARGLEYARTCTWSHAAEETRKVYAEAVSPQEQ